MRSHPRCVLLSVCLPILASISAWCAPAAAEPRPEWRELGPGPADRMLFDYFEQKTADRRDTCLTGLESLDAWKIQRETYHRQLLEMLGLDPLPERTDLKATITGRVDQDEFVVEKLHFQSRPGLYVTANLYLPKKRAGRLPAILYVCGHGGVKKNGVSYGNKVHYHHNGCWFARHGYVCLIIDSLQLGEIEATHHGTYRYAMWWWNNRGYTPAGVEAWNCVRALDYLQSREEVDPERLGVTGRSGGGVYSWWIAAIDERIQAAVPVAGITDLENHVVDGCVEGHCDCMFMVNTYKWDYPMLAALVAPRALMIGNSDADAIFPKNGVERLYGKVRKVYELYGAGDRVALNMTSGGHKDTPELRKPAFRWFDRHLKGQERSVDVPADKRFEPEDLQVFASLPADQKNTEIHETFTPLAAAPPVPSSEDQWSKLRDGWRAALMEKSFGGWPESAEPLGAEEVFSAEKDGVRLTAHDFTSEGPIRLRLFVVRPVGLEGPKRAVLGVLDEEGWDSFVAMMRGPFPQVVPKEMPGEAELPAPDEAAFQRFCKTQKARASAIAFVAPRGIGPTAWNPSQRKQVQIRRRFMLLGQTRDGMRVWDVRRAIQALRSTKQAGPSPLVLEGKRQAAGIALYASLFEPDIGRLELHDLPRTHREGPILLNVRRYLDIPQAAAMAAERSELALYQAEPDGWEYPVAVAESLDWGENRISLAGPPREATAIDAQIRKRMEAFVEAGQISGAVTFAMSRGRVVHHGAAGLADAETGRPMRDDTLFAIASMTKPITATAIMILADEGKLSIDDPVAKHLPEFKTVKLNGKSPEHAITLRHLITHTSGIGGSQRNQGSLENTVNLLAKEPLRFEPGSKWQYSPGLTVCGRVIEVVSGQPYDAFLSERIFKPLGMVDTTFFPSKAQQKRLAQLYKPGKEKGTIEATTHWLSELSDKRTPNPSGGLFSTAADLGRFYQMILDGGGCDGCRVVSPSAVERMTQVQTGDLTSGFTPGNGWGLGWCVVRQPEGVTRMLSAGTFGHGGAFGTQGWVDPKREMVFVLLIQRTAFGNSDNSDIRGTFQSLAIEAAE